MAPVRSCVCFLVILVHLQVVVSKPIFDWLFCDLLCDDDDITSTSTTTDMDLFSFDCSTCPMPATTPRPAQSVALSLPGLPNGLIVNVSDTNGVMQFVLNAMNLGGGGATAVPAVTMAPAAAPANTTAAP